MREHLLNLLTVKPVLFYRNCEMTQPTKPMCITRKATAVWPLTNLLQCFCLKPSNMPRRLEEDILANPAVILIVGVLVYIPFNYTAVSLLPQIKLSWVCCTY